MAAAWFGLLLFCNAASASSFSHTIPLLFVKAQDSKLGGNVSDNFPSITRHVVFLHCIKLNEAWISLSVHFSVFRSVLKLLPAYTVDSYMESIKAPSAAATFLHHSLICTGE